VGAPESQLDTLARDLGMDAADAALVASVTHSSYATEHRTESNERLEFLGDAVVGLVIAERAYRELDLPEGGLAQVRQATVSAPSLADASRGLHLDGALRLGRGEEASGGRDRDSLLADAYEAVVAAVYLREGLEAARTLVLRTLDERFVAEARDPGASDAKSRLQEWSEAKGLGAPHYDVTGEGPGHERRYTATVRIAGEPVGSGEGPSKKVAELAAARAAWDQRDA
jgi:ribonuclease III